jgi:thiosulfate/3-mercaptopyruvate sulfurtransferase
MSDIISVNELKAAQQAGDILIFDCRFSLMDENAGRATYDEAHIPGAYYADLNKQLSSPHIPGVTGRHPLPDKNVWIKQVQQWGITPQHKVVVYDAAGGAFASRMWWMLRWIGHDNVAVLDGGWPAWLESSSETSSQEPEAMPASNFDYAALDPLTLTIDVNELDGSKQLLLDAREQKRFDGEMEPIDPVAGHIPGALCSPTSGNLDANGSFKSKAELREKFKPVLDMEASSEPKEVVCYCGSGVSAAQNILSMRVAGLPEPRLYVGSWSEWITDPERPVATKSD